MELEYDNEHQAQLTAQNLLAQLSDFGLNPLEWQLVNEPWYTQSPALIESKQDNRWRMVGYLKVEKERACHWQLQDLQLLSI